MNPHQFNLHAIVQQTPQGLLEASLVELRIVVSGADEVELLDELSHALESWYEIAIEQSKPPFVDLCRAPSEGFLEIPNLFQEMGTLNLRPQVAMALAAVVHARSTGGIHIKSLMKAA